MKRSPVGVIAAIAAALALAACGDTAKLPESQSTGATGPNFPELPKADPPFIPTLEIAKPDPWPKDRQPATLPSLQVQRIAPGLQHPRSLLVLPNGDVLVSEGDTPAEHDCGYGIRGWIEAWVLRRAGASGPSADRLTLLRYDKQRQAFDVIQGYITGLKSPFGIALVGNDLYVANTDALVKYPYDAGKTHVDAPGVAVRVLSTGCINHHWTRSLVAARDGTKLYVGVGSNSDHGEMGPEAEAGRAAIWELDLTHNTWQPFASGLRNPNGLAWEPGSGALWVAVNERDELGSDLVPDYMTSVTRGANFGWPCIYYGDKPDSRVKAPWNCSSPSHTKPDYALGNHTASLGLAFANGGTAWPAPLREGVFVAQHGSWNRNPWSGYKVIFVPFAQGKPSGAPIDVLWGFREGDTAYGRPVSVALDASGALLVVDDVGNTVWRVAPR